MPPRKRKSLAPDTPLTPVPSEILDQFVRQGPLSVEELEAAVRRFKKAIVERALGGELTHHLGYPPGGAKPEAVANHRNGTSPKTVITDDGRLAIDVPRDREGTFEPRLIPKHARRFAGFDDKILALYARGMTVREIQAFLAEMYAVEVSPDLISSVTDSVVAEVTAWQQRPLESMYPVVFFDALRVKIREEDDRPEQGGVSRARGPAERDPGHPGPLDRANGGGEILDEGLHRPQGPRVPGHPHRRHRWPQGHERGAGGRVSADDAADLPRPSAAA